MVVETLIQIITFDIASNQFRDYFNAKQLVDNLNLDFSDVSSPDISSFAINSVSSLEVVMPTPLVLERELIIYNNP